MRTLLQLTAWTIALCLFTACASSEKMLDEGRYDDLISLAHKKLAGKKNKKEKYILAAEEAFRKVTARDMGRINQLKQSNRPEDWERILTLAHRIEDRQRLLQPLLPLVSKDGYEASFTFVKTDEIRSYAEDQVVIKLYEKGSALLTDARLGDKRAAQDAYEAFDRILNYTDHFRNVRNLLDEARNLGIVKVRVVVDNQVSGWVPGYITSVIEEDFFIDNSFWTQFLVDDSNAQADLQATLVVTDIVVGPDAIHEEEIQRSKKVEDGWQYVLDERGNVLKDSLGNDVKETRYTKVYGSVIKTHQEKIASIDAFMKITDLQTNATLDRQPLHAEVRFHHMGRSHFGDARALSNNERKFIGLVPFPSDQELILQATESLKPLFVSELDRSRYL